MGLKYKVWKVKGNALLDVVVSTGTGLGGRGRANVEGDKFGKNLQDVCGNCALIDAHKVL